MSLSFIQGLTADYSQGERSEELFQRGRKGTGIHMNLGAKKYIQLGMYMCAKSLQLCLTLYDPMDCIPPGPSVHGILQARVLEWGAMPSSRGSSQPRDQTHVSCGSGMGRCVLYH